MKYSDTVLDLKNFPIGSQKDWKFGLITRYIYRAKENKFEIDDTSSGWQKAIVDKKTLMELFNGEKSLLELDWK
jgi:hypothetical protein